MSTTLKKTEPVDQMQPDARMIRDHLNLVFETATDGAIEIGWTDTAGRPVHFKKFALSDIDAAADHVVAVNAEPGVNVYFRPATIDGKADGYTTDQHFIATTTVWADLDEPGAYEDAGNRVGEVKPNWWVVTGKHPHSRAQLYWRLDTPTSDADALKPTLKAIQARLNGDGAVTNPTTLMRVGGSVAWPYKRGRVAEVTELVIPTGARPPSYSLDLIAGTFAEASAEVGNWLDLDMGGGGRDIRSLLEATRQSGQWHTNMRAAVASLIGRGESEGNVRLICGEYCDEGDNDPALTKLIESAVVKYAAAGTEGVPWPDPDMSFLTSEVAPPPWLDDYLPTFWSRFVRDTAESKSAPPDFVAMPLLATASALIGNACWVKPWEKSDWTERPNLWTATVGDPGSLKSPAAAPIFEALSAIEAERFPEFEERLAEYRRDVEVFREQYSIWQTEVKEAVSAGKVPPDFGPVEPDRPSEPCLQANDATLEKLVLLMAGEPKGLLYRRDELAGWLENMDRYGGGGDRPFWLEAWTGGSFVQHRVKHDKPIRIPRLAVALFGTTQPEKLARMLDGVDDGLISRILWARPARVPFRPPEVSGDNAAAMAALKRLADLEMDTDHDGKPVPRIIPFAKDAEAVLNALATEMDSRLDSAGGLMAGTVAKARGHMVRLALTLTYLKWAAEGGPEPQEVLADLSVMSANLIVDYFLLMARRVFEDAALSPTDRDAAAIARWIKRTDRPKANAREMQRGEADGWHGTHDAKRINAALGVLVSRKIVVSSTPTGEGGRPRVDYLVNPKFLERG